MSQLDGCCAAANAVVASNMVARNIVGRNIVARRGRAKCLS
jgi:hypothetical protein